MEQKLTKKELIDKIVELPINYAFIKQVNQKDANDWDKNKLEFIEEYQLLQFYNEISRIEKNKQNLKSQGIII
jgi:hypothetical protein